MGKKIDAYFLTVLVAICFYLYFFQATQKTIPSLVAALICCVIIVKTFKRVLKNLSNSKHLRKRRYRKHAKGMIMELACADPENTSARLKSLLENNYQEHYNMEFIQSHPDEKLTHNAVFQGWKKHRGEDKLVVCATCRCDTDVRMMASSLRSPRVAIIDAEQLKCMMAENPKEFPISKSKTAFSCKFFIWKLRKHIFCRRNAPRCILFALSSILMYIISGNIIYLCSSMFLFIIAILSLRHVSGSAKLF